MPKAEVKIILADGVTYLDQTKYIRRPDYALGWNEGRKLLVHTAKTITLDEMAKRLWEVSRDQAGMSMFVKPWEETKQEVKEFYVKQASAVLDYISGGKG